MVSYHAWTSIVFEVLQDRGGVQISDIDDGADVMSFAARHWQNHKARLQRAGPGEARQIAYRLAVAAT